MFLTHKAACFHSYYGKGLLEAEHTLTVVAQIYP